MLVASFISALLMWCCVWLLTRREGSISLRPVLLVSLAACAINYLALHFLGSWGLPLVLVALCLSLVRWCALSLPQSLLVGACWVLGQVVSGLLFGPIY